MSFIQILRAIAWLWDDHSPTSPWILVLSKWSRHAIVSCKKDMRDEFTFTIASRVPYESHTRTKGKGNIRHLCDSYWRMISLQKGLVDSDFNFCSVQQWSCSSFAFMCIVTPRIFWEGLTTRLQCMEHRSLVLFNHRHHKGSDLMPCNGSID